MYMGPNVIRSLMFHTTKGVYGPFGEQVGEKFTTRLKQGMIVGFHGRKGLFLDAIGVHMLEGKVFTPPPTSPASNAIINLNEVSTPEAETPKWSFKLGNRGFAQEVILCTA